MQIYLHRKTIRYITDRFETFSVISHERERHLRLKMMLEDHSQMLKTIVGQEYCLEALQKIMGNWAEIEEPIITRCILEVR